MSPQDPHPLRRVLDEAAYGRFPMPDGVVDVLPVDGCGTTAIVEFTGHSFVLCDRAASDELFDGVDGYGGATDPRFVLAVAAPHAVIGSLDVVLVRLGGGSSTPLPRTDDHDEHPRVVRARHHRRDVEVLGDHRGLVTIGSGLVGRTELSVEVVGVEPGAGAGRALIMGALATRRRDEIVYAQVAPGNAASLRAFLACGFVPIGSEVLIGP